MVWEIILLFFIGFVQSFIGTLAGSGGLIGFPALILFRVPVHSTIAAMKLTGTISSLSGLIALKRKGVFKLKSLIGILPFSLIGGVIGSFLAIMVSEHTMKIIAVILLCFALGLTFAKTKIKNEENIDHGIPRGLYPGIFGVSVYSGAFGPGQATLLMQLLFRRGISYLSTVVLTRANSFFCGAGAAIVFIYSGDMIWHVAIPLTLGGIFGAQIAVRVAHKFSKTYVQWFLRVITLALIIQILYELMS